jgi:hypothetical protein
MADIAVDMTKTSGKQVAEEMAEDDRFRTGRVRKNHP